MATASDTLSSTPTMAAQLALDGKLSKQRLGSLQAFQARIADRIAQAHTVQSQALLSINVQGINILVTMTDINELLPMQDIMPLPLAKQWVKGLTVVRAEVLTVFDLAYCLNTMMDAVVSVNGIDSADSADSADSVGSEDAMNSTAVTKVSTQLTQQAPISESTRLSNRKLVVLAKAAGQQLAFLADHVLGTVSTEQAGWVQQDSPAPLSYIKRRWQDPAGKQYIELSLPALFASQNFINLAY
jgi:CheW-like domain